MRGGCHDKLPGSRLRQGIRLSRWIGAAGQGARPRHHRGGKQQCRALHRPRHRLDRARDGRNLSARAHPDARGRLPRLHSRSGQACRRHRADQEGRGRREGRTHPRDLEGRDARYHPAGYRYLRRPRPLVDQVCPTGLHLDLSDQELEVRRARREVSGITAADMPEAALAGAASSMR